MRFKAGGLTTFLTELQTLIHTCHKSLYPNWDHIYFDKSNNSDQLCLSCCVLFVDSQHGCLNIVTGVNHDENYMLRKNILIEWAPSATGQCVNDSNIVDCEVCWETLAPLLSTLMSVAIDLFNKALWLDNELSARLPNSRYGQWTDVKIQMGCQEIIWWNWQIQHPVTLVPAWGPKRSKFYSNNLLRHARNFNFLLQLLNCKKKNWFEHVSDEFHPWTHQRHLRQSPAE